MELLPFPKNILRIPNIESSNLEYLVKVGLPSFARHIYISATLMEYTFLN